MDSKVIAEERSIKLLNKAGICDIMSARFKHSDLSDFIYGRSPYLSDVCNKSFMQGGMPMGAVLLFSVC